MSAELIGILSVGVTLGGLMLVLQSRTGKRLDAFDKRLDAFGAELRALTAWADWSSEWPASRD